MRITDRLFGRTPVVEAALALDVAEVPSSAQAFAAIGADSIPSTFFGMASYSDPVEYAGRVSRRSALQVPAVKRGRDLVPGTLGTLPVDLLGPDNSLSRSDLFMQPEKNTPRSVTMARTYEDLWFEGVAWWYVTEFGWHGYPVKVKRLDPRTVNVRIDGTVYVTPDGNQGMAWDYVDDTRLIRFDSPTEPLLTAGARAIRASLLLDQAALRYADGAPMADYFEPDDGYDPDEDEIDAALDAWLAARKQRSTGWVPSGFKYNLNQFDAQKLQLQEARTHAAVELARVMGLDPTDIGAPGNTSTYFNAQDRNQQRVQNTLRQFHVAVEERLSMNDVCPRGYIAKTRVADLLRADDLSRFNAYEVGLRVGAIDGHEEVRALEGKPPLTSDPTAPAVEPSVSRNEDADV